MFENFGIRANFSQARIRVNMKYGYHYQARTRLGHRRFEIRLESENPFAEI